MPWITTITKVTQRWIRYANHCFDELNCLQANKSHKKKYNYIFGILLVVTHEWFDFISFTVKPHGCVFLKSLCLFLSELNCNIWIKV